MICGCNRNKALDCCKGGDLFFFIIAVVTLATEMSIRLFKVQDLGTKENF